MGFIKNFFALQLSKPRWLRRFLNIHPQGIAYVKAQGVKFFLFLGDSYGPSYHLMHWGVNSYEAKNQKYLKRILDNDSVFVDVGANVGIFSTIVAIQGPQTKVYAFDPEPKSRECIEATARANNLKNIHVSLEALSDHEGEGVFFVDLDNHGGSSLNEKSIKRRHDNKLEKMSVRLTTIDAFVERENLKKIDVIKIDVQEHEYEVLGGARKSLARFRPIILVECSIGVMGERDLFTFFDELEYRAFDPVSEKVMSLIETKAFLAKEALSVEYSDLFFFPQEKGYFFNENRQHLVFLTEHLAHGGAERALLDYLHGIDRRKYRLSLILRDEREDNYLLESVPSDVHVKTIYPSQEKLSFWKKKRKNILPKLDLTLRLKCALGGFGHCDLLMDFAAVMIKQGFYFPEYKKVFWIHGPKTHMGSFELAKFSLRLRTYDMIVTVSDHLKTEIIGLIPRLKNKVVRLYNPVDLDRIRNSAADVSELSAEDKILLQGNYVLAVARFAMEKDFNTLISAYGLLKKRGFLPKLYIIGYGPMQAEIEEKIKTENLCDDVILLGARFNPYIWMKNAQLFLHSAFYEGFGLVILEAMILGKAVIATDAPVGPREILQDGKFGKLVPVGDANELSIMIAELYRNIELCEKYQKFSLMRSEHFGSDVVLPDFYKILDTFDFK